MDVVMPFIKKIISFVLFPVLLLLVSIYGFAAANGDSFNVAAANRRFDAINIKLSTQNLDKADLQKAIIEIEGLQDKAELCVDQNERQLELIAAAANGSAAANKAEDNKISYLGKERQLYQDKLISCKLFILRSRESISAFKETLSKLTTSALLTVNAPIWNLSQASVFQSLSQVNSQTFAAQSGLSQLSQSIAYLLLGLVIASLVVGLLIVHLLRGYLAHESIKPVPKQAARTLARFVIPILVFGSSSIFFWLVNRDDGMTLILEYAAYGLLSYSAALAVVHYVIGLRDENKRLFAPIATLVSFLLLSYFICLLFTKQPIAVPLLDLSNMVYIIVLNALTLWLLWPGVNKYQAKLFDIPLKCLLVVFFIGNSLIACFGYLTLSRFLVTASLLTILLCGATCVLVRLIKSYAAIVATRKVVHVQRFLRFLDIKPHNAFIESVLIESALYLMVATSFVLSFFKIWRIPENYIYHIESLFVDGFTFASVSISILSIIYALLLFSLVNMFGRAVSARILRKHRFSDEQDTQSAIASIVGYISFFVALVASLIVLGINFTGLAIIIGALSVGVGLGLQSIVNNFVSGLILLIEKPIKSGDRILVNDVEGFVKKVRIRSTQVMTLAKEDVIIPNSDLVTKTVTNYMFRNNIWRLSVPVGVAYGSNIELVKEVLMEVALAHPEVLKEAPHQPIVLFKEFGDSSLNFEVWCIIPDVNRKYYIVSDLHFAIDTAFRQHKIVIAFPQRDIHIKDQAPVVS